MQGHAVLAKGDKLIWLDYETILVDWVVYKAIDLMNSEEFIDKKHQALKEWDSIHLQCLKSGIFSLLSIYYSSNDNNGFDKQKMIDNFSSF